MGGRTKDIERREARDQAKTVGVGVAADARLREQRDAMIEQRRNGVAANVAAVRDLRKDHASLADVAKQRSAGTTLGPTADVDTKRLAEVEARQIASLQEDRRNKATDLAEAAASIESLTRSLDDQRARLDAQAARPGADGPTMERARAVMDQHHAELQQRANQLTAELRGALARRELSADTFRRAERDSVDRIARSPEADKERSTQYDAARDTAVQADRERSKVANAEVVNLKQQLAALRFRADAETVGRMRQRMEPALKDALRTNNGSQARISDEAIQRVSAILLAERERSASAGESATRERAALEHAKGQLLEEIVGALLEAEVEEANRTRPEAERRRVIPGDAIRTDDQKKLGDAMVVADRAKDHLRLDEAWEVKAGPEAARELSRRKLDLSENDVREAMQQAIDATLDRRFEADSGQRAADVQARIAWEQKLTNEQMADALVEAQIEFDEILTSKVQTEAGQPEQLRERLRASTEGETRFFESGRSRTVDNDRDIRIRTAVPSDVYEGIAEGQRQEMRRIEIDSARLRELAEELKKQLQDDRYW